MTTAPVLYVEDEENDAFFMRRAFQKLALTRPLQWVSDGTKAIAYLAGEGPYADRVQHPLPVAMLLDLNLGLLSGFDVLNWLRARPQFRSLPVVIFSSSNEPRDKEKALHLGASDFISKPQSGVDFPSVIAEFEKRWLRDDADPRHPAAPSGPAATDFAELS